jgi:hypothetical protein
MADPIVPLGIYSFQVEMKINIFAFVREKITKATVCLVSREWRNTMVPMTFENLTLRKRTITREVL